MLEEKMSASGFWDDPEAARKTVAELKSLKAVVSPTNDLLRRVEDVAVLYELAVEADSAETLVEAADEAGGIEADLGRLELRTLLSGPHDGGNCYFSVHAGAGGTESCDWAQMLMRMYLRYFERSGYAAEEIDRVEGEEAGIRSATLHVTGPYCYGYL
ncbi:unnamed protein product, partial [marine sediment metagenome]